MIKVRLLIGIVVLFCILKTTINFFFKTGRQIQKWCVADSILMEACLRLVWPTALLRWKSFGFSALSFKYLFVLVNVSIIFISVNMISPYLSSSVSLCFNFMALIWVVPLALCFKLISRGKTIFDFMYLRSMRPIQAIVFTAFRTKTLFIAICRWLAFGGGRQKKETVTEICC